MAWIDSLLGRNRVVEYRLSDDDRQMVEGLQLQLAAVFDEVQAFSMEMSATRSVLEGINENLVNVNARRTSAPEKGKGRTHRSTYNKDNQRQGKGEV